MGARGPRPKPFIERILRLPGENACWLWTGAASGNGYGEFHDRGHTLCAHRVAWELANGPIPAGMVIRHKCDNKLCVRPDHLEVGTQADNQRDKAVRRRGVRSKVGLPYGVRPCGNQWQVLVRVAGRNRHLGCFTTIEEAKDAAELARIRMYGPAPEGSMTA
jgi:hypothetical protein